MSETTSSTPSRTTGPTGPTSVADRSLAPDLARGAMLLLIAVANVSGHLYGRELGLGSHPVPETVLDRAVTLVQTALIEGRGYPLFAALLGYGVVQLSRRHLDVDTCPTAARRLVRRRGWWLLLFGFAHALLLWAGDILAAYGVVTVALAGVLLRVRDRTLLGLSTLSLVVVAIGGATSVAPVSGDRHAVMSSTAEPNPLFAAGLRMVEWAPSLVLQPLGIAGAVLLGVWAGRRRLLEQPQRQHRRLAGIAATGIALATIGGLPLALLVASGWQDPPLWLGALAGGLHYVSGYGGIGYAALIALSSTRVGHQPGPVITALSACGKRSLTCYLAQSVVFVAVLSAHAGGLGDQVGLAAAAAFAAGVWILTVAIATLMHRQRRRGPAETLLRRLTYGGPSRGR